MLKGIFGASNNGSEVSSSSKRKSERRERDGDEDSQNPARTRADSTGNSSFSKRKSSGREVKDQSSGFHPTSTAFSSSSRAPYAGVTAPSIAASYATAFPEPLNAPTQRPVVVRNESMVEEDPRSDRAIRSKHEKKSSGQGDLSRSLDNDDNERRNAGRSNTSSRGSRRRSSRNDTATRPAEDPDRSLPQNQFPGQEPAGVDTASPYRPPGLASDYYGDHGESIAEQPGVRLDRPAILTSADQAHLMEPTLDSKPPPEPSSQGRVGAAAEFFGGGDIVAEPMADGTPSRPGRDTRPGRRQSLKPRKDSTTGGASPRSSPGPDSRRRPLPQGQNSSGIGEMNAGARPLAAGAMAAGVGAAAEYYTGNIPITPHDQPLPSGVPSRPDEIIPGSGRPYPSSAAGTQSQSYQVLSENMQTTSSTITSSSSRPSRPFETSASNVPLYGAAAAAAGIAGAAYLAHEHTSAQHEQALSQLPTSYDGRPSKVPLPSGQNQSQASFGPQQQRIRRRRKGAFGKLVDWWEDPAAVAEYEAYTEAIGVCKYCFEPGTTPAQAPRKHNYRRQRRSSGSRYGSSTRVDKLTRYSSDENLRRRNSKKGYSTTEKVLATGLAGVGVAAVANEVYKKRNDFDDTCSVKSGRPDNRSKVLFQENEDERYSTSKRKSRRESTDLLRRSSDQRRQSGSEGEVRYERRPVRRRDSSGSDNRAASRGGNLSTPVALAGAAAVGAALTSSNSRRRSRSRSKSSQKNRKGYYSKRVSPKHSYVNLNESLEDPPSGPLGLGGFFSSPSSNSKHGKKEKGLFSFNNNSSSSSDADLVFGEGTVRRKERRRRKDDRRDDGRQNGTGDTAAILGLAATGAVLAAETSKRDDKGKGRDDRSTASNRHDEDRSRRARRADIRNNMSTSKPQEHQESADNGDEGIWEDASDDQSSVDMGLAYGGNLSSRTSKESLNQGTTSFGGRFSGNRKTREDQKPRRKSTEPDLAKHDPVQSSLLAGAAGLAGAAVVDYYSRPVSAVVESPPKDMPPLQYVDPVPVDSREQTLRKQSRQTSASPMTIPTLVTRTSDATLEHPQPITPIANDLYRTQKPKIDAPSESILWNGRRRDPRGQGDNVLTGAATAAIVGTAAAAINDVEREGKQEDATADTLPSVVPSPKDSVSFDLTKEQEDREQRRERKRREKEARKSREAAAAAQDAVPKASIITGPERSPERKLETWRLRDAVKAGRSSSMEPPIRDPLPVSTSKDISNNKSQPLPTPERETRLSEIDRQLEELYAQHREQESRKKEQIEAAGLAAGAVAVGAGVIAATSESAEQDKEKPRRKSSLRKSSKYHDQGVETESAASTVSAPSTSVSETGIETASERLARRAARKVQNHRTSSPMHQYDDYTTFFVPPELKEHMTEHNRDAEVDEAKIVDIVPTLKRAETFPDHLYHAYGTEDTDVSPTKLPWKVPMLGLVSPTPPPQLSSMTAEKSPVILATSGSKDVGEPEVEDVDPRDIEPKRSSSKVTWGDHEINVYEVITPEYERDGHDFTEVTTKKDAANSPLRQAVTFEDDVNDEIVDKDMDQPVPPVEKMTKEQQEHVALGKEFADLPASQDGRFMSGTSSSASEVSDHSAEEKSRESITRSDKHRPEGNKAATEARELRPESTNTKTRDVVEQHIPGGFDDIASDTNPDGHDDPSNEFSLPTASILGEAATSVLVSDLSNVEQPTHASKFRDLPASQEQEFAKPKHIESFDESAFVDSFATPKRSDTFATPKRSDTFDEGALIDSFVTPRRAETFAEGVFSTPQSRTVTSDPEDWEKASSSRTKSKARDDDDYYASRTSSSKTNRGSQTSAASDPDDDSKSAVSDTKSAASDASSSSKQKGKNKDYSSSNTKKSSWALIGGLIGIATASKGDISSKSETSEKSRPSNDSGKRSRKARSSGADDMSDSTSQRSRSASQSSGLPPTREESLKVASVGAQEDAEQIGDGVERGADESFLAGRPGMPKSTGTENHSKVESGDDDGASGLPVQSESQPPLPGSETRELDIPPPQIPIESSTSIAEQEQGHEHADSSSVTDPRQPQLRNLQTTDLGSTPSTSSPARPGRFPISSGIIHTGSVGSPSLVSNSSPLSTSRKRQGRSTSTDFRSGKEFRPLYLVERNATRAPAQDEDEKYPSLPSSRTSSAHPSLENLRGDFSDEEIEDSSQPQSRDIGRRYSWSDSRTKSPDFLDSSAATPTQSTFPESFSGMGEVKEKSKPKYEFHSPSDLLDDPSKPHQDAVLDDAERTSLPTAMDTDPATNPSADAARSIPSSDKEISSGPGTGIAAAAVGVFAAGQLLSDSRTASSAENPPVLREIEVQEPKEKDFELQPTSSKAKKKDKKKKKRRALDSLDDDVDMQDPRGIQVLAEEDATPLLREGPSVHAESKEPLDEHLSGDADTPKSLASVQTPAEEAIPTRAAEQGSQDEWASPTKKSKKGKAKEDSSSPDSSVPQLSTIETEPVPAEKQFAAAPQANADQLHVEKAVANQPKADTDQASDKPTTAIEDSATRDIPQNLTGLDTRDVMADLDKKSFHSSLPSEDVAITILPTAINDDSIHQEASISSPPQPKMSAFEAAFEAACVARGLPAGVSKDTALNGLAAPFREDAIRPVDVANITQQGEKNPFNDDFEVGKSSVRDVPGAFIEDTDPDRDVSEIAPEENTPGTVSVRSSLVEMLPVIEEAGMSNEPSQEVVVGAGNGDQNPVSTELDEEASTQHKDEPKPVTIAEAPEDSQKLKDVEQTETLSEQINEVDWALPQKGMEKKKSKKKSKTVDESEGPTSDTAIESQTPADAEDVTKMASEPQITEDPAFQPANDDGNVPVSGKKSKKDKKAKRKSKATDDLEPGSLASGSQTPANKDSRDVQEPVRVSEESEQLPMIEEPKEAAKSEEKKVPNEPRELNEPEELKVVEQPVEDEWTASSKKPKKGKKSKKKSIAFDDLVSESPVTESQTPDNELDNTQGPTSTIRDSNQLPRTDEPVARNEQVEKESSGLVEKSKENEALDKSKVSGPLDSDTTDNGIQNSAVEETRELRMPDQATKLASEESQPAEIFQPPPTVEEAAEAVPAAEDDIAWAPTKKGKKAKKSKRKTLDFDSAEPTETSTPSSEPYEVEQVEASDPVAANTGAAFLSRDEDKPVEDDERAATTSSERKKDKKAGKKGKTSSSTGEKAPTPVMISPELEQDMSKAVAAEEQTNPTEEPATGTEVDGQPAQELECDVVGKSTKSAPEEDFPAVPDVAHVDSVVGHYFGMLKDYQPVAGAPDNRAAQANREAVHEVLATDNKAPEVGNQGNVSPLATAEPADAFEEQALTNPSVRPQHAFPVMPRISHVNDVVSFHYGLLRNYKPDIDDSGKSREIAEQVSTSASEATARSVSLEAKKDDSSVQDEQKSKNDDPMLEASQKDFPQDTLMIEEPRDIAAQNDIPAVEPKDVYLQSTFDDSTKPSIHQSKNAPENDAILPIIVDAGTAAGQNNQTYEVPVSEYPATTEKVSLSNSGKSKKAKKNKRKSTLDDFDEQNDSPAPEKSQDVPADDDIVVASSSIVDTAVPLANAVEVTETPADMQDQPLESSTRSKKDKKKKKGGSTFDEFETGPTASASDFGQSTPSGETEPVPESQRDLDETIASTEDSTFTVPGKKSKKDKKKKRQSTIDDFEDQQMAVLQAEEHLQTESPAKTSTKQEAKKVEIPTSSTQVPILGDDGWPVVQPAAEAAPSAEEEWAMPTKKSKKDKQEKKTLLSWADGEDSASQPTEKSTPTEPAEHRDVQMHETVPAAEEMVLKSEAPPAIVSDSTPIVVALRNNEADHTMEQEKHQSRSLPGSWGEEGEGNRIVDESIVDKPKIDEVMTDEPTPLFDEPPKLIDEPMRDAEESKESAMSVPKVDQINDEKERQSARDMIHEDSPDRVAPFPVNNPDHAHDVAGHYHRMLREYQPASGISDNKSIAMSRKIVNEPNIPHVNDVTGHYYGMLRAYQPAEGAPDNKSIRAARKAEDVPRAEMTSSPVSDEDTRRARRVRRMASPVYSGEEPEDLPGKRSLTPPVHDDDMMTTALGVAAGLGLTGAAASAASVRSDAQEVRSLDDPRAVKSKAQASTWSFANIGATSDFRQAQRDSGVQFADSPTLPQGQHDATNRDSGYIKSPANRESWHEENAGNNATVNVSDRPPRPQSPTSSSEDVSDKRYKHVSRDMDEPSTRREPSPVHSTSKERSSKLFTSSPSSRVEQYHETPRLETAYLPGPTTDIHRSPSIHGHHKSREELRATTPAKSEPRQRTEIHQEQVTTPEPHLSIFGPYPAQEDYDRGFSPPKTPLHTISEHSRDTSPSLSRKREVLDVAGDPHREAVQHQESETKLRDAGAIIGAIGPEALAAKENSRDDRPASRPGSLGKSKANTKSARSLRRTTLDYPDVVPPSNTHGSPEGTGREVARDMADVYDGHGEYPGSSMSPTRPPSMRKRQSMQQIRDLETRLDQLTAENRTLAEAKIIAERHLEDIQLEQHKSGYADQEAVKIANVQLREKDEAIARLQQELESIKTDHARLTEVNAGLNDAHENLRTENELRYSQLEDLHAETHQNWQESSRELEALRGKHAELSGGVEDLVQHNLDTALAEKNAEIERLRSDLALAKDKINELEQQILSGGGDDILNFRDEDYFENACRSLCQHVQQWVLRFSKFSDTLVCRTTTQIRDEQLVDRFDLAILDGSDVDVYLTDRIKRRDVFMSVVMTMIFEYIFTRYLFGMDRDQRQTLKKLEKNLAEVGPPSAVHQWRAMTLTLLAKRESFKASRENDTEAVVLQIYDTLAKFLPPPQNLQAQVQESLRNVMRTAIDLSIEMRTQKAEYIMLPPLQPEYDTNGDLTRKVYFNASLMNERSGETTSNDELEAQHAVVRMVLFPLVVKKGNDDGEGEEEIVVCPAQVLVARPDRRSKANSGRVVSAQSDRMSIDQMSKANASRHSLTPSAMDMSNVI